MVLYLGCMCQCRLHMVHWVHIGTLMCLIAAEPCSTTLLLFLSQYLCGTFLVIMYSMVQDLQVSRAGPMSFYWTAAFSLSVSHCFPFNHSLPALHCQCFLIIIIIFTFCFGQLWPSSVGPYTSSQLGHCDYFFIIYLFKHSYFLLALFCFFVFFHFCYYHVFVLGTTLVHDFHIFKNLLNGICFFLCFGNKKKIGERK